MPLTSIWAGLGIAAITSEVIKARKDFPRRARYGHEDERGLPSVGSGDELVGLQLENEQENRVPFQKIR